MISQCNLHLSQSVNFIIIKVGYTDHRERHGRVSWHRLSYTLYNLFVDWSIRTEEKNVRLHSNIILLFANKTVQRITFSFSGFYLLIITVAFVLKQGLFFSFISWCSISLSGVYYCFVAIKGLNCLLFWKTKVQPRN